MRITSASFCASFYKTLLNSTVFQLIGDFFVAKTIVKASSPRKSPKKQKKTFKKNEVMSPNSDFTASEIQCTKFPKCRDTEVQNSRMISYSYSYLFM
jgi:hypothetical protein